MEDNSKKTSSKSDYIIFCVFVAFLWGIVLYGVFYLLYDIWGFLNTGEYHSTNTVELLLYYSSYLPHAFTEWLSSPTSWIGIHKILGYLPACISLFIVGITSLIITGSLYYDN